MAFSAKALQDLTFVRACSSAAEHPLGEAASEQETGNPKPLRCAGGRGCESPQVHNPCAPPEGLCFSSWIMDWKWASGARPQQVHFFLILTAGTEELPHEKVDCGNRAWRGYAKSNFPYVQPQATEVCLVGNWTILEPAGSKRKSIVPNSDGRNRRGGLMKRWTVLKATKELSSGSPYQWTVVAAGHAKDIFVSRA